MKRPEALDTLRELDKQAPHPTHVTAFLPDADPNREVWTLSNNPDDEGWDTDCGYSGFGMTKAMATVYAEARNALPDILAYVAHLEQLLAKGEQAGENLGAPWPSAGPSPTGVQGTCENLRDGRLKLTLWNGDVWSSADGGETWTKGTGPAGDE